MTRPHVPDDSREEQSTLSRRNAAAAVGALLGIGALSGCDARGNARAVSAPAALAGSASVQWADTVEDLRLLVGTNTHPLCVLKGYWEPGDGGGGTFFWDDTDTTSPDDGGTLFVPELAMSSRTGCWRRLVDDMWSVRWFGARGDGATDDSSAFADAIAAMAPNRTGQTLFVPAGTYRMSVPLVIDKSLVLTGAAGGGWDSATVLKFDATKNGIEIAYNSPASNGGWCVVRNLSVHGSAGFGPSTADDPLAHGIVMRARALISHVHVILFRGDGINIYGNDLVEGTNSNCWVVEHTRIEQCGRHGLHVAGPDANAGVAIAVDSSDNGKADEDEPGWGILDGSFLGNTYIGCHTDSNAAGPYCALQAAAASVVLGCYSEAGQPPSRVDGQSMAFGGQHESGIIGWQLTKARASPMTFHDPAGTVTVGHPGFMGLQGRGEALPYHFTYQPRVPENPDHWLRGWYGFKYAGLDGGTALAFSGREAEGGEGRAWAPNGIYVGRQRVLLTSIYDATQLPRAGRLGDVCFNLSAYASGIAAWQCVQQPSGSAPARWRAIRLDPEVFDGQV